MRFKTNDCASSQSVTTRLPVFQIDRWVAPLLAVLLAPALMAADAKQQVADSIQARQSEYASIAEQIWHFAELGFKEYQSSELLQSVLRDSGFEIDVGVAGMPTAFVASYGKGEPVIAFLAEFDALPGLSQAAVPRREPVIESATGHGCGHHLLGTASVAAAIAVAESLTELAIPGTVRVYGTPAEEGGAGKVYMVREGLFGDVDAVLQWHPNSRNRVWVPENLAVISGKFRFRGISTHAAAAPHLGRSALDGAEAMNDMVNLMREHIPSNARIHYIITHGGDAPNVVPQFAEVYYYVRHPEVDTLKEIWQRVVKASEGAALGTGTSVAHEIVGGVYPLLPNLTLSKLLYENLSQLGGIVYTPEERAFAEAIRETPGLNDESLGIEEVVAPFEEAVPQFVSTDVGDVSWVAPTSGPLHTATWVPGTPAHSWQAVAAGGTSIGTKGMMVAAKTLAMTAMDLFTVTSHLDQAREEFEKQRGEDFTYTPLVGEREPPLDYRE